MPAVALLNAERRVRKIGAPRRSLVAVRKTKEGAKLKRWFAEEWRDTRTGKKCGRSEGEKRGKPYCRPTKRVSSATPKTAGEMTAEEKRKRERQKASGKRATPTKRKK